MFVDLLLKRGVYAVTCPLFLQLVNMIQHTHIVFPDQVTHDPKRPSMQSNQSSPGRLLILSIFLNMLAWHIRILFKTVPEFWARVVCNPQAKEGRTVRSQKLTLTAQEAWDSRICRQGPIRPEGDAVLNTQTTLA